jgi:hypothetical protein
VIGGYTLGGNPFDALIVGCYEGPKLKYIAKVRAGFVPHMRCALYPLLQEFRTDLSRGKTWIVSVPVKTVTNCNLRCN